MPYITQNNSSAVSYGIIFSDWFRPKFFNEIHRGRIFCNPRFLSGGAGKSKGRPLYKRTFSGSPLCIKQHFLMLMFWVLRGGSFSVKLPNKLVSFLSQIYRRHSGLFSVFNGNHPKCICLTIENYDSNVNLKLPTDFLPWESSK